MKNSSRSFRSSRAGLCHYGEDNFNGKLKDSNEATYDDNLGAGFLVFPIVVLNEPPNKLNRSEALRSSVLLFLLCRLVGTGRVSCTSDFVSLRDGDKTSFDPRPFLIELDLAFREVDSAESPKRRLRLPLPSWA